MQGMVWRRLLVKMASSRFQLMYFLFVAVVAVVVVGSATCSGSGWARRVTQPNP